MALQAVRTLSVPEPLPLNLASGANLTNPSAIHSVASLGAWNASEYSHQDTPASSPQAPVLPRGSPRDAGMQAELQRLLGDQLHSAGFQAPSTPPPAGQVADRAAQLPAKPDQVPAAAAVPQKSEGASQPSAGASGVKDAAQLHAESATLPTIAEEEPTRAIDPTEGAPVKSQ